MFRPASILGALALALGLGSCDDPSEPHLLPNEVQQNRFLSKEKGFVVSMAWDEDPAHQPVGTSLSGTASFEVVRTGEAARDLQVVDVFCRMLCCGTRSSKTPQWEKVSEPHQVRISDVHPDSSGLWQVKICARVDGDEAESVDIVVRTR